MSRKSRVSSAGSLLAILAFVLAFAPPATAQLVQTVYVPSGASAAVNGANLLAAYAGVPGTAGPTEPWVVKVDAGIFDLGSAQLVLRNFVDLEGSGRNATFIRSVDAGIGTTDGTLNVPVGIDAEIRDLTAQNESATSGAAVINNSTELKLSTVNLEVDVESIGTGFINYQGDARLSAVFSRVAADGASRGFDVRSGGPIVNEAFAFVVGPGSTIGFESSGDSAPVIQDLAIVTLGSTVKAFGFYVLNQASPQLINARISAFGPTFTRGVLVIQDSQMEIEESIVQALGEDGAGIGLRVNDQARVFASDSRFVGNYGIYNLATTEIHASIAIGATAPVANGASTATTLIGATQLNGPVSAAPLGILRCAQSYDGSFMDLASNCL